MVKQKIHTARNQTFKAHRNGIKKPKRQRYRSTKGVRYRRQAARVHRGHCRASLSLSRLAFALV